MLDQNPKKLDSMRDGSGKARNAGEERRKSIRQVITELDQDIIHLLARRFNLLNKIRQNGKLDAEEEKYIREAWQKSVARVSHDPKLASAFFSLMQELSFLPKPQPQEKEAPAGPRRRQPFNLAQPKTPVQIDLRAPLDSFASRFWIYLAAAAGKDCIIQPTLQNDAEVDFVKALERMGAKITQEDNYIRVEDNAPLAAPDTVLYLGSDVFNFYLLLAHYLGRPSRVKFDGERGSKMFDFSPLCAALRELGTRMVNIVPKSFGWPCRLECSGSLPPKFRLSSDIGAGFGKALLLAAPFYEQPFAVDVGAHALKSEIMAQTLPILESCGASFVVDADTINLEPSCPAIPARPDLPISPELGLLLLSFAAPQGGETNLQGKWPVWSHATEALDALARNGIVCRQTSAGISLKVPAPLGEFKIADVDERQLARHYPLFMALCACAALNGGEVALPPHALAHRTVQDFFGACGLGIDERGRLVIRQVKDMPVWIAPDAMWAAALALAAGARKYEGFQLGNPGIMTKLWPKFWFLYNNLPKPDFARAPVKEKARRRILTGAVAVPPPVREEE